MFDMSTIVTPGMITVDCRDPRSLAQFWSQATGAPILADYDGFFVMVDGNPKLGFQLVSEPTPGKNRVHVDFHTDNRVETIKWLQTLGATVESEQTLPDGSFSWTVLHDPEGNVFCVSDQEH
ncbi:Glyoxalase-like domain [Corynebacterium mustelae]|uniref:Glyoxalase-like domain n=2 Tax=Corynebacterium mustelae TaxID=571915 RepID=A0A0G3H6A4_9CORY|nr:Glyoxalase-like domain [Corynebacterium mustelae]